MEQKSQIFIASGPVIIEDGKVLLNRGKKDYGVSDWLFPGGKVENLNESLEDACRREAKEEMGIDLELIRPLRTLLQKNSRGEGYMVLAHYLAKRIGDIIPGAETVEWGWHKIHALPDNTAENVHIIIDELKNNI